MSTTVAKQLYLAGVLTVLFSLILGGIGSISGEAIDSTFFASTGLTMLVISLLLRNGADPITEASEGSKENVVSFLEKHTDALITGGLVFAGLALIGGPIVGALIFGFAEEMDYDYDEGFGEVMVAVKNLGGSSGPTYYAFLLGLIYFLSPKDKKP